MLWPQHTFKSRKLLEKRHKWTFIEKGITKRGNTCKQTCTHGTDSVCLMSEKFLLLNIDLYKGGQREGQVVTRNRDMTDCAELWNVKKTGGPFIGLPFFFSFSFYHFLAGVIAQLVEHCNGTAGVGVRVPLRPDTVNDAKCFLINSFSRHGPYCYCDTFSAAITYCCNTTPLRLQWNTDIKMYIYFFGPPFSCKSQLKVYMRTKREQCLYNKADKFQMDLTILEVFDSLSCLNNIIFCRFYFLFHWIET